MGRFDPKLVWNTAIIYLCEYIYHGIVGRVMWWTMEYLWSYFSFRGVPNFCPYLVAAWSLGSIIAHGCQGSWPLDQPRSQGTHAQSPEHRTNKTDGSTGHRRTRMVWCMPITIANRTWMRWTILSNLKIHLWHFITFFDTNTAEVVEITIHGS